MSQVSQPPQANRDKLVYLRQWVGNRVAATLSGGSLQTGVLTNIVFDGTRLMYVMLDDIICLNFDHIIELKLQSK